jgi:hypothetical protein
MELFNELFSPDFGETLLRFAICLFVNWVIVNYLYFKKVIDATSISRSC